MKRWKGRKFIAIFVVMAMLLSCGMAFGEDFGDGENGLGDGTEVSKIISSGDELVDDLLEEENDGLLEEDDDDQFVEDDDQFVEDDDQFVEDDDAFVFQANVVERIENGVPSEYGRYTTQIRDNVTPPWAKFNVSGDFKSGEYSFIFDGRGTAVADWGAAPLSINVHAGGGQLIESGTISEIGDKVTLRGFEITLANYSGGVWTFYVKAVNAKRGLSYIEFQYTGTVTPPIPQPDIQITKTITSVEISNENDIQPCSEPVLPIPSEITIYEGDTLVIGYSFKVENTGNAPLTNVTITDGLLSSDGTLYVHPGALGAGEEIEPTPTATYRATYADLEALLEPGQNSVVITNTATVTGIYDGNDITDSDDATITVILGSTPPPTGGLTLTKTVTGIQAFKDGVIAKEAVGSALTIGSNEGINRIVFTYGFEVKNEGDVDLTNVWLNETGVTVNGNSAVSQDLSLEIGNLGVNGVFNHPNCEEEPYRFILEGEALQAYLINSSLGAIRIVNTAEVTGEPCDGPTRVTILSFLTKGTATSYRAEASATATINISRPSSPPTNGNGSSSSSSSSSSSYTSFTAAPRVTITKTASPSIAKVGDTITYTLTVANTGNVELTDVKITDPFFGSDWEVLVGRLASQGQEGSTFTTTMEYTIKAEAVVDHKVVNVATVVGIYDGNDYTAETECIVGIVEIEEIIVDDEDFVADPPKGDLPYTGGATAVYIMTGIALAGAGMFLRKRF